MRCIWGLGLILAGVSLQGAEPTPGPLPPDKAARSMVLPDGFRSTVFAAEPDVVQPVSFCIDDRGRLFVAEAMNYGTWQPTGKDRITILEDRNGDGQADHRTVFYEGFNYITGIEVGFGGVWVVSPPGLYFIPDKDGDDRPDGPPELLFDGFGYKESRHNLVNGFTWGPDGWLYGGHGRTSPSDVGRPGTPPEQRIHCDGGVYRIHPTRLIFENYADGTTNPWGVDFNDVGECFVSNCVNPHLFHMIPGGHYEPWRNRPSSLYAYQRIDTIADHLHYAGGKLTGMRGETAESLTMGGGHAHCGTLVYLGDSFPKSYRNTVLMCNIHGRRINNDILKTRGSGYIASHGKDLMLAGDPWFMGVTLRTGPDGNLYVSDWSDTGECHTYKPHTQSGRIYKIAYGDARQPAVDLTKLSDLALAKLQAHDNEWHVQRSRRILQERAGQPGWKGTEVHAHLQGLLSSPDQPIRVRLRALWALHVTGGIEDARMEMLLNDRDPHVRVWAIRLLSERGVPGGSVLQRFEQLAARDASPVVRLALASVLQRLPIDLRWGIMTNLVKHGEDAADPNLPLMLWYALEPMVPVDPQRALDLAVAGEIPLVRQYVARRVVDEVASQGPRGELAPLARVLAEAPDAALKDLIVGAGEGARGRKRLPMPANWARAYARTKASEDGEIRSQAIRLALILGDPQAMQDLRTTARASEQPVARRREALQALIEQRVPDLAALLLDVMRNPELRSVALRGLAVTQESRVSQEILSLYPELTKEERAEAVATLATRKEWSLALLEAVEAKTVARQDISAYIARQIHTQGDARTRERLKAVWGSVRDSSQQKQAELERYKALLTPAAIRSGNAANGRAIYSRSCLACHKFFGEGGAIGPELTGSNRNDLDYLLMNLIDPSAQVAKDYRMSTVTTVDGQTLTGILVENTPTRVILQTTTERLVIPGEDVESAKESQFSIMPEGQLDTLSPQEVKDLFAYLTSKTQVPVLKEPAK